MPADFGINHAHYVKIQLSTVLRRNKNMAVEGGWGGGGTVSHNCILVFRKFIEFMSRFRHSVWFAFSFKPFSCSQSFDYATYGR